MVTVDISYVQICNVAYNAVKRSSVRDIPLMAVAINTVH